MPVPGALGTDKAQGRFLQGWRGLQQSRQSLSQAAFGLHKMGFGGPAGSEVGLWNLMSPSCCAASQGQSEGDACLRIGPGGRQPLKAQQPGQCRTTSIASRKLWSVPEFQPLPPPLPKPLRLGKPSQVIADGFRFVGHFIPSKSLLKQRNI